MAGTNLLSAFFLGAAVMAFLAAVLVARIRIDSSAETRAEVKR